MSETRSLFPHPRCGGKGPAKAARGELLVWDVFLFSLFSRFGLYGKPRTSFTLPWRDGSIRAVRRPPRICLFSVLHMFEDHKTENLKIWTSENVKLWKWWNLKWWTTSRKWCSWTGNRKNEILHLETECEYEKVTFKIISELELNLITYF